PSSGGVMVACGGDQVAVGTECGTGDIRIAVKQLFADALAGIRAIDPTAVAIDEHEAGILAVNGFRSSVRKLLPVERFPQFPRCSIPQSQRRAYGDGMSPRGVAERDLVPKREGPFGKQLDRPGEPLLAGGRIPNGQFGVGRPTGVFAGNVGDAIKRFALGTHAANQGPGRRPDRRSDPLLGRQVPHLEVEWTWQPRLHAEFGWVSACEDAPTIRAETRIENKVAFLRPRRDRLTGR